MRKQLLILILAVLAASLGCQAQSHRTDPARTHTFWDTPQPPHKIDSLTADPIPCLKENCEENLAWCYYNQFIVAHGGILYEYYHNWEYWQGKLGVDIRQQGPNRIPPYEHCADSALKYFTSAYAARASEDFEMMYYPIVQLENFLGRPHDTIIHTPQTDSVYDSDERKWYSCYFPVDYFLPYGRLSSALRSNHLDVFGGMTDHSWRTQTYSCILHHLDEPYIYGTAIPENEEVLRITICSMYYYGAKLRGPGKVYRIQKKGWKLQYTEEKFGEHRIGKNVTRKLGKEQQTEFQSLLEACNFYNLPRLLHDGKTIPGQSEDLYLIEYMQGGRYHAVQTLRLTPELKAVKNFLDSIVEER